MSNFRLSGSLLSGTLFSWPLHLLVVVLMLGSTPSFAQTTSNILRVGPGQAYSTIRAASLAAKDGDVVEIQAGQYVGDVAVWPQTRLTIRGVGGRAQIVANGASVEGKGIWVIRNGNFIVENIEFTGARVPDRNGAGIRFENGTLTVRNSVFKYNENGILTHNNATQVLTLEGCEFGYNGYGDGYSHNLYAGKIGRLTVTGSYFHHARHGQLLKSRAKENFIINNRLSDETGGLASYELSFPNGGLAYVIGNIIQQSATSPNYTMITIGEEGIGWPQNQIYLVNNTIVNDRTAGGTTLRAAAGTQIKAVNNLLLGNSSTLESAGSGQYASNARATLSDFVNAPGYDYQLRATSAHAGKAVAPGIANNFSLRPTREYVFPWSTRLVRTTPYSLGALQTLAP